MQGKKRRLNHLSRDRIKQGQTMCFHGDSEHVSAESLMQFAVLRERTECVSQSGLKSFVIRIP